MSSPNKKMSASEIVQVLGKSDPFFARVKNVRRTLRTYSKVFTTDAPLGTVGAEFSVAKGEEDVEQIRHPPPALVKTGLVQGDNVVPTAGKSPTTSTQVFIKDDTTTAKKDFLAPGTKWKKKTMCGSCRRFVPDTEFKAHVGRCRKPSSKADNTSSGKESGSKAGFIF